MSKSYTSATEHHLSICIIFLFQSVISLADRIKKKLEKVLLEDRGQGHTEVKQYAKKFISTTTYFQQRVQKKHQVYMNVYKFFLSAVKVRMMIIALMLRLEYSRGIISIPLLLMPWLLLFPCHKQPWYWLLWINSLRPSDAYMRR